MILLPVIYILINIIHAGYHWYLIVKRNKLITSVQKVIEYGLACVLVTVIFLIIGYFDWPLVLLPLLTRAAVFDPCLNLLRGKSWLYEGQISKRKSFVDWVENLTGLPVWVFRITYLLTYIGYLIYYYAT